MNGGKDIVDQTLAHSNANTTSWPARDNSHRVALAGGDRPYPEVIAHRVVTAVASMKGDLLSLHRPSPVSPPPSATGPPPGSEEPPVPPELPATPPSWPALDRLGLTQAIGGLALGLIALFSSYDHLTFAGRYFPIPQQWGIPLIAASVATVFVDAQLASGSRLRAARDAARAAEDAARAADETTRERHLASEERQRADRERNRAAEARERQAENFECIRQAAVLSARVQLDPSDTNRARLQTFLNLLSQTTPEDLDL